MKISQTDNYETIAKMNEHVQEIHTSLYPKYFKEYNYPAVAEFFKGIVGKPQYIFLLLEEDEPIGYAWIEKKAYPENAFKKQCLSVYVHQISIIESYKHKGYGSTLMDEIEHIAREIGAETLELDYWVDNAAARDFYKKKGFTLAREFVEKEI
ncbi:GNAT family N-acetyltransferase [Bacillus sp. T33-2]|uniref:GNAT family N-acetyltransferase n=1 Tax=Bacillus sp. T33-2 TaxID=2054168 RepID=UPI000C79316B|nr:GNAT family N-acetyltransferase [Bacillus sp. T33-2]PLR98905.1 GNAT family N-acetyltransferase [Bacillus sp. T33-2]